MPGLRGCLGAMRGALAGQDSTLNPHLGSNPQNFQAGGLGQWDVHQSQDIQVLGAPTACTCLGLKMPKDFPGPPSPETQRLHLGASQHMLGHQGQGEQGSPPQKKPRRAGGSTHSMGRAAPDPTGPWHQHRDPGGLTLSRGLVLAASVAPRRSLAGGSSRISQGQPDEQGKGRSSGKITWVRCWGTQLPPQSLRATGAACACPLLKVTPASRAQKTSPRPALLQQ